MHTYRNCNHRFYLFTHLLVIFWLYFNAASCFSVKVHILSTKALAYICSKHNCQQRIIQGKGYRSNCCFTLIVTALFFCYSSRFGLYYCYYSNLAISILILVLPLFRLIHPRPLQPLFTVLLTFQNTFLSFTITFRACFRSYTFYTRNYAT